MRLRTLPVSVAGVIAGTGVAGAYGRFEWLPATICMLFAVMAQIVSNFANEYFDFRNGLDKKGREGFRRGVTEGDITPKAMGRATFGLLALTCLTGCTLIIWGGWQLIPVGILIALFALGYSTGPYPLSHHGLGDLAVVIFFGLVPVFFTAYVQVQSTAIWPLATAIGVAVGLMAANVLIVNNYRDYDDDREVGKRTTVVIFGRKAMSTVYLINGFIAAAITVIATFHLIKDIYQIGALFYVNENFRLWQEIKESKGAALNPLLGKTAMVLLVFSAWIAFTLFIKC